MNQSQWPRAIEHSLHVWPKVKIPNAKIAKKRFQEGRPLYQANGERITINDLPPNTSVVIHYQTTARITLSC